MLASSDGRILQRELLEDLQLLRGGRRGFGQERCRRQSEPGIILDLCQGNARMQAFRLHSFTLLV